MVKKQLCRAYLTAMRVASPFFSIIEAAIISLPIIIGLKFPLYLGVALFMIILTALVIFNQLYITWFYNRWFYEFTPDNLKIERGIIWKKYSNIPYERVQNVDITRGIFARIFGFSSVNIQTAGYSGYGGGLMGEGFIPGVDKDEAEKIREFLMKKNSG
ncbi:PH domain-containing protein [Candidatus Pacearchaeota archaeon]|nr:PH domain-containing protein [Candidatus Pacearchaeota archaeon]